MTRRLIDLTLLAAIAVGGVLAWRSNRERADLQSTADHLAEEAGELPLTDPGRIHLTALETGDPMHFAWRIYVPASGSSVSLRSPGGSFGAGWSGISPLEYVGRVRFREGESGLLEFYSSVGSGGNTASLGDEAMADLLRGRWDEIRVDRAGEGELVVPEEGETTVLLRLSLPEDLAEEARRLPSMGGWQQVLPDLFTLEITPRPAKP
ncbi:hypothetical protein [Tautonia plasticadhaerens]|uniref:Uncharacterized protein n=1 Tax=Tautonia plasticadhaerens TaxID=2527974 RepID=A0A518H2V4_9BACT|nr:hypothetical protein [Tautonia plasticadhaerens]QDV35153.1 hypothetical protein ElP_30560 [Tautonia plasticadhaerens]